MLGLGRARNSWNWIACGKHPVARDYIRVGHKIPPLELFSDWLEQGYNMLAPRRRNILYSWRFWSGGSGKQDLVCGLGKDSSDSLGRWYPFLIAGYGPLPGWQSHWDLLPLAAENTWAHLESVSVTRFMNFKELEDAVRLIPEPDPGWTGFLHQRDALMNQSASSAAEHDVMPSPKGSESDETTEFLDLQGQPSDNPLELAILWLKELRKFSEVVPNAVFMGGAPSKTYLSVFRRPLAPEDFVRLWSISSAGVSDNGAGRTG